jgi:hypothetical protein
LKKNNWMNFILLIANLIIPIASFYLFSILSHHGPAGNESLAQWLYIIGIFVVVLDLLFIFKKREKSSKKIDPLNVVFLLLVFIHLAVNSVMFYLVKVLMQM